MRKYSLYSDRFIIKPLEYYTLRINM